MEFIGKKILLILLLLLIVLPGVFADWWNDACDKKRKIEFLNNNVTDMQNVTFYLELNDNNYNFTGVADPYIVKIINSSETGVIQHYSAFYDSSINLARVHFKDPSTVLNANTNRTFYVYYDCSLSDTHNQSALARPETYLAHQWLFDTNSTIFANSTVNNNVNVTYKNINMVEGIRGSAVQFRGDNTSNATANSTSVRGTTHGGDFGISLWFKCDVENCSESRPPQTTSTVLFSQSMTANPGQMSLFFNHETGRIHFLTYNNGAQECLIYTNKTTFVPNIWHHIYIKRNNSGQFMFVDGRLNYSDTISTCQESNIQAGNLYLGCDANNNLCSKTDLKGTIEDLRFWMAGETVDQNESSGWNTYLERDIVQVVSSEVPRAIPVPPNPTLLSPANNSNFASVQAPFLFEYRGIDDSNTTLIARLIINGTINATNTTYQNNTNASFLVNLSRGKWSVRINISDGQVSNVTPEIFINVRGRPNPTLIAPFNNSVIGYTTRPFIFNYTAVDDENETLLARLIVNNSINISNTFLNNTNGSFIVNLSRGVWRIQLNVSDGFVDNITAEQFIEVVDDC